MVNTRAIEFKLLASNYKGTTHKTPVHIKWYPPPSHKYKLNIDASMDKHNTGGIGSVIRNSGGDWIIGFFNRIKAHNSTHAELQALQAGLNLAYEQRLAPLEIDTDSTDIIKLLQHNISPSILTLS
uniref:RNase H type-1 domain-containing protein n=1 Tax=Nicotiana tabacum TaxID=4097 RepID=A0A1S4B024_TOBAC|nr:PREDICTED: uncharacterized protein LOC107803181 [Nicotiana tabacum]